MSERDEGGSGEVEVRPNEAAEAKGAEAGEVVGPRLFSELGTGSSTRPLQPAGSSEEPIIEDEASEPERPPRLLTGRRKGSVYRRAPLEPQIAGQGLSGGQRLLILDAWRRSELTAGEFGKIAGVTAATLYAWRRRFEALGPAGLDEKKRGAPSGTRVPEATRRAILMMKGEHEDWGCDRIHDMLMRSDGFMASAGAVAKVLREAGYESEGRKSEPHPDKPREFERAKPNQLWQTDLFTSGGHVHSSARKRRSGHRVDTERMDATNWFHIHSVHPRA
jgi:transposase